MPAFLNRERDRAIGARLLIARVQAKLSRRALGLHFGISRQQVLNYETGASRLPASMLHDLAEMLGKSAVWFLETDHTALAKAACLELPRGAVRGRQFCRALAVLSPGATPGRPAPSTEAARAP